MATTKILPVRKRLKDCLDYAANPKKTEVFRGDALDRLMHYTQNEDKTEHQLYVTGFNCDPQNACLIMEATKRRWHKDIGHGNVGYHIIQSFKPGEASPDQVHQIGCELARRCLADRFECTVSTHLDKGHLHNHIVVNSVSFMDGKMFRNDFKTYYQGIRQISDDLCRQNRLSVIETDGRGISYGEWRNRREGKPTLRGMVKADVEMTLAESADFDDFVCRLQKIGYEVKYGPRIKHMAVRHQDSKRFVRLDGVAPQFSESELRAFFTQLKKLPPEMQQEYQAENQPVQQSWQKEPEPPVVRRVRCRSRLNRPYKKVGGIMACYYHYCALLRRSNRGKSGRRCYYLLREDFSKFNRYRRQCDLLWEQKIESTEELLTYRARLTHELEVLTQKRKYLYNHKDVLTPDVRNRRLEELSARILYESPLYERNLSTMMDMILECKVSEDSYDENRMDILFGELEQRDPHHPAVLQYRSFKLGSAKTLSSIMVTAVSNLHMLQSAAFAEMIATDEMFLPQLGVEKRAIFCVIPDNDDTFNFMVSILYTQLFDQLFRLADSTPEFHGTLPVHVRLMMDEFANVATPENFVKILAVLSSVFNNFFD